jgi:hypothetical protein
VATKYSKLQIATTELHDWHNISSPLEISSPKPLLQLQLLLLKDGTIGYLRLLFDSFMDNMMHTRGTEALEHKIRGELFAMV